MSLHFSKTRLVRSICQESFYEFAKEFWSVVVSADPVWNWHIKVMCDEYQKAAERVFAGKPKEYDLIINVPPGSTKSTILSVMSVPWTWTRFPQCQHICGSYSYTPLGLDLSRKSRDIVQSDKYRRCFPDVVLRDDQNTKGYFGNTKGGWRLTVGKDAGVTGLHAHIINVDDPLDPQGAKSEVEIKGASDWLTDTLQHRKVDKTVSLMVLVMQRLHQDDPTGAWLKRSKGKMVKHICLPAIISDNIQPPELRDNYKDDLLDPIRLSRPVLEAIRLGGERMFAGQYMQTPIPAGGGIFRVDRFKQDEFSLNPNFWQRIIRYWDKAGSLGEDNAYTAGVKMGIHRDGRIVVLDVKRFRAEAFEREQIIKATAEADGKHVTVVVEQEPGSGGKESAQSTIRNLVGFKCLADRPTGDKMYRADPYAAQVNAGNVTLQRSDWNHDYVEELRYFGPEGTYKDQTDASSGAFSHLVGQGKQIKVVA